MDLGLALITAIGYEKRAAGVYAQALEETANPAARRVLALLADEENGHVSYLESRLELWRANGSVGDEAPRSLLPDVDRIRRGAERLAAVEGGGAAPGGELEALRRAIAVERETSEFYARMVDELDGEGQRFFARFVAIEDGHLALVQAELGALEGTGHWFDVAEFDLESA